MALLHYRRVKWILLALVVLQLFSGCNNTSTHEAGGASNNSTSPNLHLVVGGKLDVEAQLLTEMYVLLLQKHGFTVIDKAAFGTNDVVFNALQRGDIDLYPEFTETGLARLHIPTTHNAVQDYNNVKQGYEQKFHVTWLNPAPLNDTYGICTSRDNANTLKLAKISDLVPIQSQLTIATPPDGKSSPDALPALKQGYNIVFNDQQIQVLQSTNAEDDTFQSVIKGSAYLNVCYTSNPLINRNNFVLLQDDKQVFPQDNPAPIVRDDVLSKAPSIFASLNPLAHLLTTDVSIMLQNQVKAHFSVREVAKRWLQSEGLL
jgi:osmoprotectant transport system substrate-binding protein